MMAGPEVQGRVDATAGGASLPVLYVGLGLCAAAVLAGGVFWYRSLQ
jgi:hypothetical protein